MKNGHIELNPDAVKYCGEALRLFANISEAEVQKIAFEIATWGSKGLSVSDPAEKYSLHSLLHKFTALHLLCLQYVGFRQIEPTAEIGFDLEAEYQAAKKEFGEDR